MINTSYPILYGWSLVLVIHLLLLLSMFIIKLIAEKIPQKQPDQKKKAASLQAAELIKTSQEIEISIAIAIAMSAQKGNLKMIQTPIVSRKLPNQTHEKAPKSSHSNRVKVSMWREFPGKTPDSWNTSKFPLHKQKTL